MFVTNSKIAEKMSSSRSETICEVRQNLVNSFSWEKNSLDILFFKKKESLKKD